MRGITLALLLAAPCAAGGETASWSAGTARVLPDGRAEVGVFAPLRYGIRDRIELSAYPVWFAVAPNADVKIAWGAPRGIAVASQHGLL